MTFLNKLTLGSAVIAAFAFTAPAQAGRDIDGWGGGPDEPYYHHHHPFHWFFSDTDLVTNRKLYSPKQGEGHFTEAWYKYHEAEGIFGVSNSYHRGPQPGPDVGIFGVSNSRNRDETSRMHRKPGPDEGIFGISHP
jgi:hypothetical protein